MSEDVTRIVGSGGQPILINGKEVVPQPLDLKRLGELQREGVRHYRRNYLEALKSDVEDGFIDKSEFDNKREASARWTADDLPTRDVFIVRPEHITSKLKDWLLKESVLADTGDVLDIEDGTEEEVQAKLALIAATFLDNKSLPVEKFKELTGKEPKAAQTGWVNWWVTASPAGMMAMVYHSISDQGVSRQEFDDEMRGKTHMLIGAAREVESITAPAMGNT